MMMRRGGSLVSFLLNRIESPLTVFCFTFLREVDSMTFGVHVVMPSLSGVLSSPQIRLQHVSLDTTMV
jgi:hypothetical protein